MKRFTLIYGLLAWLWALLPVFYSNKPAALAHGDRHEPLNPGQDSSLTALFEGVWLAGPESRSHGVRMR